MPTRIDEARPVIQSGFSATRIGMLASSVRIFLASAPMTTATIAAPEASAATAACATSEVPLIRRSCFGQPIREEAPAARTMAPSLNGRDGVLGMNGAIPFAERAGVAT